MKLAITGGHHSSALPLIDYIKEEKPDIDLLWFGHKFSMKGNRNPTLEYRQITARDIPFIEVNAGKFYKTYNPLRLAKIPFGFFQAFYYLLKIRPDVVLSFGGYLAVPVVFAAWVLGIPSITHEQTLVTGYANKFISYFVDEILISHEESREFFPDERVRHSGLPLREALFDIKSNSFNFDNDLPVLYITAGKTGSHKINVVIQEGLESLLAEFNVIHQCGDHSVYKDYDVLKKKYEMISEHSVGRYFLRKFVLDDEIGEVFNKADVYLSRAGAHITYEIKTFRKPSVLVPIPWVSHNEQYKNAELLVELGLGIILKEENLNCDNLLDSLKQVSSKISGNENFSPKYTQEPIRIMLSSINAVYEKKISKKKSKKKNK